MGGFVRRATVGVALAAVTALTAAGAAQAWSGAGALVTGRYNHTATLLRDGRVLVAGGNNGGPLDSARLYDAGTRTWSAAAPMRTAREGHSAVLLRSGKVLVAGGLVPSADPGLPTGGYARTAEVYDPGTNTWEKTAGTMSTGRFEPTMTVLQDGRVLVAGGSGDIDTGHGARAAASLASAEIYDPATDRFTDVPPMSVPRGMATATLLGSGKVLVAGGFDNATGELGTAELYDPSANAWAPTGSLGEARDSATATELPNGDVLVAGGDGGAGRALATAEIYQSDTGSWHAAPSMPAGRQGAAAALLEDGTVLVGGGQDGRLGTALDTTVRYDAAAGTWTDGGVMAAARQDQTLTALRDGGALVVGGSSGGFHDGLGDSERFSPVSAALTPGGFGSRLVGGSGPIVHMVLTSTGSAPLVVTGLSVAGPNAGDFVVATESCLASPIPVGATCDVGVQFTPSAEGVRSATLVVNDNTAAGTTTASLTGTGQRPATAPGQTSPDGGTPPTQQGAGGGNGAAASAGGASTGSGQPSAGPAPVAGAVTQSQKQGDGVTRAICTPVTAGGRGRGRSTVTCTVTWATGGAVPLRARLMHGTAMVVSARTTVRGRHAALRLRPQRRLRPGRYSVVIARADGTIVVRDEIRIP